MNRIDDITPIIEGKLRSLGLELYECKFIPAGRHSILRVFIDKPGGVTIGDCEQASHALSLLLDVEEFTDQPYTLEVSSPGIDRPLKTERDFRRVVGERVTVWQDPSGNSVCGVLLGCEDCAVRLDTGKETLSIPLARVKIGRVDLK